MDLTPAQAQAVLHQLLSEKIITARDITRAVRAITDEIASLEERLAGLRELQQDGDSDGVPVATPRKRRRGAKRSTKPAMQKKAAKANSNPARAKSMQRQGLYLSLLNKQPKNRRAKFKRLAQTEGREAAIKAMGG